MLANRNSQIPNGLKWYCPVLKYTALPNASFRQICEGYAQAVRGNMILAKQRGLPTTMTEIENAVDAYNTKICQQNGWTKFYTEAGVPNVPFRRSQPPMPRPQQPLPQPKRTMFQSAKNIAVGARTIVEWIASGAEAVPQEQANKRASVCAVCPQNSLNAPSTANKPLSHWFTVPVAAAISAAMATRDEWHLQTPDDIRLGVCLACECPLKLKLFVPFDKFYDKMTAESKAELHPDCWINTEAKQKLLTAVNDGLAKQ